MLPHVKYDKFEVECRQKMQDMKSCVEVTSCPCPGEMVSVNGPIVSRSQGVVEETMKVYWAKLKGSLKNGRFTRRSDRIKSYTVSKSIDALNNQVVQTPFVV